MEVWGDDSGTSSNVHDIHATAMRFNRVVNCGSGIGVTNATNVDIVGNECYNNTNTQGITCSSAVAGSPCADIRIAHNLLYYNGNGIELENTAAVVSGNISHNNVLAGIRITSGSSNCVVVGNIVYGNNTQNSPGVINSGIVLDHIAAVPRDNVVMGNRCFDYLGATGTQLYGIGQDTAVQGSNNLIVNNDCRGNKTADTLNVTSPLMLVYAGGVYNLTGADAVITGLTTTVTLDTDSLVLAVFNCNLDWTTGTAAGNLGDDFQAHVRLNGVGASLVAIARCDVAGNGKQPVSLQWYRSLAAGTYTVDVAAHNTAGARGQLNGFCLTIHLIPAQQWS
jgi:hypothetical protein